MIGTVHSISVFKFGIAPKGQSVKCFLQFIRDLPKAIIERHESLSFQAI
jgi:predicted RNase H-like nuclease